MIVTCFYYILICSVTLLIPLEVSNSWRKVDNESHHIKYLWQISLHWGGRFVGFGGKIDGLRLSKYMKWAHFIVSHIGKWFFPFPLLSASGFCLFPFTFLIYLTICPRGYLSMGIKVNFWQIKIHSMSFPVLNIILLAFSWKNILLEKQIFPAD